MLAIESGGKISADFLNFHRRVSFHWHEASKFRGMSSIQFLFELHIETTSMLVEETVYDKKAFI